MSTPADIVSEDFWLLIAEADNNARELASLLDEQTDEELRHFHTEFAWVSSQMHDMPFTEFASADREDGEDDEGVLEDAIEDIAAWVVSQGKEFYIEVWNNPELIAKFREDVHATHVGGVAAQMYWARVQEPLELDAELCDEYDGMF